MPKIQFIESSGLQREVETESGKSLMEVARANGVPGIDGDCGGVCACATCHVYIEDSRLDTLAPQSDMERDMLELAHDVRTSSRLACQISVNSGLDSLVVHLPEHQH